MITTGKQPGEWKYVPTGEANVFRIVTKDDSDWVAVIHANAIYEPGMQSADGEQNVVLMTAAPDLLRALVAAKEQIKYLRGKLTDKKYRFTTPTTVECFRQIDYALIKATPCQQQ